MHLHECLRYYLPSWLQLCVLSESDLLAKHVDTHTRNTHTNRHTHAVVHSMLIVVLILEVIAVAACDETLYCPLRSVRIISK